MLILEKLGSRYGLVYKFVYKQLWEFQVNNLAHWFLIGLFYVAFLFFILFYFFVQRLSFSKTENNTLSIYNIIIISAELIEIQ